MNLLLLKTAFYSAWCPAIIVALLNSTESYHFEWEDQCSILPISNNNIRDQYKDIVLR